MAWHCFAGTLCTQGILGLLAEVSLLKDANIDANAGRILLTGVEINSSFVVCNGCNEEDMAH